ncbi:MAG TPA: AsmA family protein [Acidobacteriaceae bacterium]|nr:AsmA family protein [Acidobacteriaceae bacterium]
MRGAATSSARRRLLILCALLLLTAAIVLPPLVNIGRYRMRIAALIGRSIGRPVHISSVSLRLLPSPAIEMPDFVVDEEPAFGAEPILHADNVVAYLRLSSLWRGKLEIARIHLDDASVNLVRAPNGTWNFASILVQAASSPSAPTGQRRPGIAPRFPYIEAENARIDFKENNEKKPFSFMNADLSVWLDNPDQWDIQFRAQPVRTDLDLDLADSGILHIDGTLRRAASLSEMPLDLTAKWSAAPLGQLSRLVLGRDSGWRGSFDFQARVTGTAAMAEVKTLLRVDSLHRAEFTPPHPADLVATCNASYRKAASSLENIACSSHPGGGDLSLTGSIVHMRNGPETALSLRVHDLPASAVLAGLQEVRQGFGGGFRALGELNGTLQYTSAGTGTPALSGEVGFESLSLAPDSGRSFLLAPVRFRFENPGNGGLRGTMLPSAPETAAQISPTLLLEPVRLSLGSPSPLVVDGRFTPDGFAVHVGGTTTLAHLKPLSWILARPMPNGVSAMATSSFTPEGTATLDLSVLGPWVLPFSDPDNPVPHMVVVGSVAVKNAQLTTSYLARPLKIASATAILTPSAIAWTNASIAYGAIEGQGSLEYATSCAAEEPCPARFAITGSSWSLADLQSSFVSSGQHDELLREFLNRIDGSHAAWPTLSGTVQVESLSAGKLVAHDVAATLDVAGNAMRIRSFTGRVLKGSVHLNGMVDASGNAPAYDLALQVTNASAAQLAGLFDEHWGSGQASFSSQLTMKGFSAADLAGSARGTLRWDWKDGALEATESTGDATEPLMAFSDWHGDGTIGDSTIRTAHSTMVEESGATPVSGTISFSRGLNLKCGIGTQAVTLVGNLEHPRMEDQASETAGHPSR